jgi:type III secretory pathway component EscS
MGIKDFFIFLCIVCAGALLFAFPVMIIFGFIGIIISFWQAVGVLIGTQWLGFLAFQLILYFRGKK